MPAGGDISIEATSKSAPAIVARGAGAALSKVISPVILCALLGAFERRENLPVGSACNCRPELAALGSSHLTTKYPSMGNMS
jgi:Kef-type K+ transport system membrane component KefB